MDLQEAIVNRRSIRKFLPDAVPEADLQELVEAATLAPNAENQQMWQFVAVTNREVIQKMADLVSLRVQAIINACNTINHEQGAALAKHEYFLVFFRDAPALIALFTCPSTDAIQRSLAALHLNLQTPVSISPNQQSIGAAIQNISLLAHAKGYGSTCMYGPVLAYEEIGSMLAVPSPWFLSALMPIGKPAQNPKARPRKPLSQVYKLIK